MFDQNVQRVGFACKYHHPDQTLKPKLLEQQQRPFNGLSTSIAWLNRQAGNDAEERLLEIARFNIKCFYNLITYAATLGDKRQMVRLSSDVLPAYTHPNFRQLYQRQDVIDELSGKLADVGSLARTLDVRISMHPGQFVVLASDRPDVVENSIEEFEYHATVARWMGYGQEFQDMKINVHISGRQGPEGIKKVLPRLSTEARNTLTIENEEMAWGLDSTLELAQHVPLVLDIHHHWVREGEYIKPNDDRVKQVIDSWRGVRPTCHYSVSRQDYLKDHDDSLPNMNELLTQGYKKAKLRAHSDRMWNHAVNLWAAEFNNQFDIMIEAKHKNEASKDFVEDYIN